MRISPRVSPQVLMGVLLTLLLILGALAWVRHLLWEDRTEPLRSERTAKTESGPPPLPGGVEPQPMVKELIHSIPATDPSEPRMEIPADHQGTPLQPEESSPRSGRARVLPPIEAAPEEDLVVESPFDTVAEPIEEEPPEDDPAPPPIAPEPGPDFVR